MPKEKCITLSGDGNNRLLALTMATAIPGRKIMARVTFSRLSWKIFTNPHFIVWSVIVNTRITLILLASSSVMERICVCVSVRVCMEGSVWELLMCIWFCIDIFCNLISTQRQKLLKGPTNPILLYFIQISFYDHFFLFREKNNYFLSLSEDYLCDWNFIFKITLVMMFRVKSDHLSKGLKKEAKLRRKVERRAIRLKRWIVISVFIKTLQEKKEGVRQKPHSNT